MDVVSAVVIQPNLAPPVGRIGDPSHALTFEAVQARLAKLNALGTNPIEVQVGANGQVILSGQASSLEEKAQFSRQLRGLAVCACVRNEMIAPPVTVVAPVITASAPPATATPMPTPTPTPMTPSQSAVVPPPATRGSFRPATPWSPAPPATAPALTADQQNPLLPPSRLPASTRVTTELAQMPPAPVAPYRPAEHRPDGSGGTIQAAAKDEKVEKVVPATGEATASPAAQPKSKPAAPEVKPTPATLPARNQQALNQRLRTALGATVRNLEMKFDGKGGVKVIATVAGKGQDLDNIVMTIVQAPELKDFDISLELRLDP